MTEDPLARHQLRLRWRRGRIAVLCPCQSEWDGLWEPAWKSPYRNRAWRGARLRADPIETRARWSPAEAVEAWRAWHEREGIRL